MILVVKQTYLYRNSDNDLISPVNHTEAEVVRDKW